VTLDLLIRLARTGLRRGIRYGSRRWLYTGIVAGLLALARRATAEPRRTVYRAELEPGERIQIRAIPRNP
jgi:hypothetical protein